MTQKRATGVVRVRYCAWPLYSPSSLWRCQGINIKALRLLKTAPNGRGRKVDIDRWWGRHLSLAFLGFLGQLRESLLWRLHI